MNELTRESYEWYMFCVERESHGWVMVEIKQRPFKEMQEVAHWLRENCKSEFDHKLNAGQFLFASQRDADWFKLRWS